MINKCHIGKKTLEILLVTSNFSFIHNVFYSSKSLVHQNALSCGDGFLTKQLVVESQTVYRIISERG